MTANMIIKVVSARATWPLRHRVLRPHQPFEAVHYVEDETLEAFHVAAFLGDEVIAIASVYRQPEKGSDDENAWRLRGMASAPEVRGKGYGGRVLAHALALVRAKGGTRIWCNARISASDFYKRFGFEVRGNEFELPGIGPHYFMEKRLGPGNKVDANGLLGESAS